MLRSIVSLCLVMLLAAAPHTVFAYSSSQTASGSTDGAARTFTFSSLPASNSLVTVSVFVRGDFNASSEYVDVTADGTYLGQATGTVQYNSSGNCLEGTTNFTVPASEVADGSLSVIVDATSSVNFSSCEPWTYTVTVSYDDNIPPTISNVADVATAEDTATSVSFTVSDTEDSASSLVVTATSSDTAVVAPTGLSLVGVAGSWVLGIDPVADANGTSTITLTVTDSGGQTATDTFVVTVTPTNDAPVADAGGPYSGDEGAAIGLDGAASSDIDDAIVSWDWDCDNDGTFETVSTSAAAGACTFDDDGTYTVGLQVQDASGAVSTNGASAVVTVGNVAPSVAVTGPTAGDEGSAVTWTLVGGDPSPVDAAALLYAWTVTDPAGGTTSGAGPTIAYTPADSGTYSIEGTVTDPQGASATATGSFVAGNVAPSLSISGPSSVAEGAASAWTLVGTDPSPADEAGLSYSWSVQDGGGSVLASGASNAVSWTPADDGAYSIEASATDLDGASASATLPLTVTNVAPVIDSTPPALATEGALYSYAPTVTDPGAEVFTWTLSGSAPAGMTVDSGSGLIEWTPTYADALAGTAAAVLTVDDGDGATGSQTLSITVDVADDDGDGMADSWESANGLDPTDPNDGAADPDADGLSNLDEYLGGTDPASFDGPGLAVLTDPVGGVEVASSAPDLFWTNATDPQGDALTYSVEVYADQAMTTLLTSVTGVAEDGSGSSTWKVDVPLPEDGLAWWRVQAADPYVVGAWTDLESFVVNEANAAPSAPSLTAPIGGEVAASLTPTLSWSEATDADMDPLTYEVVVFDEDGLEVDGASEIVGDGLAGTWTVEVELAEDRFYTWTARALDDAGGVSDWAAEEAFFVSTSNAAPSDVVFLEPLDGASLTQLSPVLLASVSEDPEGGAVRYWFEIDVVPSFDSADLLEVTVDDPVWDLADDGITLPENTEVYARVRALDEEEVASQPDTIAFFVGGENDPPSVPELLAPEDGTEGDSAPTFVVVDPTDPEGDVVFVEFVVARDEAMTDVIASGEVLVAGGGETSWQAGVNLEGTVFWTARARDEHGASSEAAEPWSYEAPSESVGPGDDDDDDDDATGCDCESSLAPGAPSLAWLLLAPLVAVRRRRAGGR